MLKLLRLKKTSELLKPKFFSRIIKQIYANKLQKQIKSLTDFDPNIDYNKIFEQIKLNYIFKIFRLCLIVFGTSYFLGLSWYILCEIEYFVSQPDDVTFYSSYDLGSRSPAQIATLSTYYAFTTLSTVGLGDYHPKSNTERLITAGILLGGVSMFSYIMGNFLEVLHNYNEVTAEYEFADNLSRFFGLMAKFNNGRRLKRIQIEEIEEYFAYYWSRNRLASLATEKDMRFFVELPEQIKTKVFKDFLFSEFIYKFNKLFEIRMNKNLQHSYFKWSHTPYQNFMIAILKKLEPRRIKDNTLIYEELSEVLETTFVMKGSF